MASSAEDDSSSDDNFEKQKLLEAVVDPKLLISDTKSNTKEITTNANGASKSNNQRVKNLKTAASLRHVDTDQEHELGTTPEFREFIAKKLSEVLDQDVKTEVIATSKKNDVEEETGIRLFKTSLSVIRDEAEKVLDKQKRVKIKRRKLSSSDDSSDEDRKIAAAAVSADFIIQQSRVQPNSKDDRDDEEAEPVNGNSDSCSVKATSCKDDIDTNDMCTSKKKRKKKNHKHKCKSEVTEF